MEGTDGENRLPIVRILDENFCHLSYSDNEIKTLIACITFDYGLFSEAINFGTNSENTVLAEDLDYDTSLLIPFLEHIIRYGSKVDM